MNEPDCLGLCEVDWDAGVCLSCGRNMNEIAESLPIADEDPAGDSAKGEDTQ